MYDKYDKCSSKQVISSTSKLPNLKWIRSSVVEAGKEPTKRQILKNMY